MPPKSTMSARLIVPIRDQIPTLFRLRSGPFYFPKNRSGRLTWILNSCILHLGWISSPCPGGSRWEACRFLKARSPMLPEFLDVHARGGTARPRGRRGAIEESLRPDVLAWTEAEGRSQDRPQHKGADQEPASVIGGAWPRSIAFRDAGTSAVRAKRAHFRFADDCL